MVLFFTIWILDANYLQVALKRQQAAEDAIALGLRAIADPSSGYTWNKTPQSTLSNDETNINEKSNSHTSKTGAFVNMSEPG